MLISIVIATVLSYVFLSVIHKCRSENEIINNDEKEVM